MGSNAHATSTKFVLKERFHRECRVFKSSHDVRNKMGMCLYNSVDRA